MKQKLYAFILTISLVFIITGCKTAEKSYEVETDYVSVSISDTITETISSSISSSESQLTTVSETQPTISDVIISDSISLPDITTTQVPMNIKSSEFVVHEFGYYIDINEADSIIAHLEGGDKEVSAEYILNNETYMPDIVYNDCTYMIKSVGVSFNQFLGDSNYDEDNVIHTLPENENGYFKVSVGDRFGELEVTDAYITYYLYNIDEPYMAYPKNLGVTFSGSVTLTGHIKIIDKNPGFFQSEGDIFFFPDASSWSEIPIFATSERLNPQGIIINNFYYCSDIDSIYLGNIKDYVNNENPMTNFKSGKYYRAIATITDLKMEEYAPDSKIEFYGKIIDILSIED